MQPTPVFIEHTDEVTDPYDGSGDVVDLDRRGDAEDTGLEFAAKEPEACC